MADFKINGTTFVSETGGTLSIDASQIKVNGTTVIGDASGFMFRNKIINGGMKISQRGTSFTFAHDGTVNGYTLDRFYFDLYNNPDQYDCTVSQYSMSAAEINTTGHTKALKLLTGNTGAETEVAADEFFRFYYIAEGQDVQDFLHGTTSAKTATLSFWTKSSVTGTFGLGIYRPVSSGNARMINLSYTINAVDTWEKKTILIVGDTGGATIPNDNTAGLYINWQLAAGSNWYSGTATSWGDYATTRLMGNHSNALITTNNANWYLTGVQLEIGTAATPFEHRPIGMELSLCQRYYWSINGPQLGGSNNPPNETQVGMFTNQGGGNAYVVLQNPVRMRASPDITASGNFQWTQNGGQNSTTNIDGVLSNPFNSMLDINASGLTVGTTGRLSIASTQDGVLQFKAEL